MSLIYKTMNVQEKLIQYERFCTKIHFETEVRATRKSTCSHKSVNIIEGALS